MYVKVGQRADLMAATKAATMAATKAFELVALWVAL